VPIPIELFGPLLNALNGERAPAPAAVPPAP
jgi:hypothetical protein